MLSKFFKLWQDLPPVPAVDVSLEPHHVTLPVGVVLSVL